MQNNSINNKIEEVLNSLDGINRAEANPFLYTRIKARLNSRRSSIWDKLSSLISRPVIALAGVFLILVLNLFAIYSHSITINNNEITDVTSSDEYSVVSNTYYDIENTKP